MGNNTCIEIFLLHVLFCLAMAFFLIVCVNNHTKKVEKEIHKFLRVRPLRSGHPLGPPPGPFIFLILQCFPSMLYFFSNSGYNSFSNSNARVFNMNNTF